jgi:hypothetical protein
MSDKRFPNLQLGINAAFVTAIGSTAYPQGVAHASDAFTKLAYGGLAVASIGVTAFGIYGIACAIRGTESKNEPKL